MWLSRWNPPYLCSIISYSCAARSHVLAELALPGKANSFVTRLNYVLMSHTQLVILCINVFFF